MSFRDLWFFCVGFLTCVVFRWLLVMAERGLLLRPIQKFIQRRRQRQ